MTNYKDREASELFSDRMYPLFIFFLIICLLGYTFIGKSVLNFPRSIWYGYIGILILFIAYKAIKQKKMMTPFGIVTAIFVLGVTYYSLVYIPLAGIVKYTADDNSCKTYNCKVVGMGSSSRNRSLTYKFKGQTYKFFAYQPYRGFSLDKSDLDLYYVELEACEGLFGSYVKKSLTLREK